MTAFPKLPDITPSSQRAADLLKKQKAQNVSGETKNLKLAVSLSGESSLTYHKAYWTPLEQVWFETLAFFLERKKGDWGVLFQLGIRDIENFLRDHNARPVFDIQDQHLIFESTLLQFFAEELARLSFDHSPTQNYFCASYPDKVAYWDAHIRRTEQLLSPHFSLHLVSFELAEVLFLEGLEEQSDRIVVELTWKDTTLTWTQSAKDQWLKGFFQGCEKECQARGLGKVKWVAEGGQFP